MKPLSIRFFCSLLFVFALGSLYRHAQAMAKPVDSVASSSTETIRGNSHNEHVVIQEMDVSEEDPSTLHAEASTKTTDDESRPKSWWHAFLSSFAVIVVSEIGDKTFLIAAILAMKHPRLIIFAGASSALVVMTILSAILGFLVPQLLPRQYTQFLASLLFLVFGLKMLKEGYEMAEGTVQQELEEVDAELAGQADSQEDQALKALEENEFKGLNPRSGRSTPSHSLSIAVNNLAQFLFTPMFVQTFVLTFLAEWGDRSQIATIALGAAEDVMGVSIGASIAHALCTGAAVIGGRLLASKISVRTVTLVGGMIFLLFAITSLLVAWQTHDAAVPLDDKLSL